MHGRESQGVDLLNFRRARPSLPVFLIFLVLLIGVLLTVRYYSINMLREEIQRNAHKLNTQLRSEQIGNIIQERMRVLSNLTKNQLVIDLLENEAQTIDSRLQIVLNTANQISDSEIIYVLNSEGTAIASAIIDAPLPTGHNYAFRPFFQRAMEGKTDIYPALGVVSGKRGIHLSVPVYGHTDKKPSGVLILKIDITEVEDMIHNTEQKVAILSPDGIVFASNQPDWLYKSAKELNVEELEDIRETRQFDPFEISPLGLDLNAEDLIIQKERYFPAHAALKIKGWQLVALEKKNPLYSLPFFYRILVGSSLLAIGLLASLAFLLTANINQRKSTERMLRDAEAKYRSIFENAVMGIYQTSIEGHFKAASPSIASMLGYASPDELISEVSNIGKQTYFREEDRQELLDQILKKKEIIGFETQFIKKDQSTIWVSLSGRIVTGNSQEDSFVEGFCLDITEKKRTEAELRRERDIFARVMETSPVGITLMNDQGKIKFANHRASEILRLSSYPDAQGYFRPPPYDITDLDGNLLTADQQPVALVQTARKAVYGLQNVLRWQGEEPVYLSINMAPITNNEGQIIELVSAFEDISDAVKSEKESEIRKENLIRVDRLISMGILASGVAHEINNPNTFIMMNAQLLADAWQRACPILDTYMQEHGDFRIGNMSYSSLRDKLPVASTRVIDGSRRIKRIVEELRNYSRKDIAPHMESIDVNEVIKSAEILLANMIKKCTRQFKLQLEENLPYIYGNMQRLEQVVINVLQNACQSLPDEYRDITLETFYENSTESVVIICRDEGVGIDENVLRHVFDPFFSTKRDEGGTGLGLSISSTIVQEHQGTMEIESKTGQGTTVILRFPPIKTDPP